ncbi:MAG: molybdenum cofactor guanylyltransferase [Gemmatimonadales bacterium]|nr:molybdenum cofactor guanylyltransferase [Gemmatimonadales bacterium]
MSGTDPGRVTGVILAGGGATRFGGRPKGLEAVGGIRILDRLAGTLTDALGTPPLLVANAPDAGEWRSDLRVVSDRRPGLGSLGGIYTAVLEGPAPVVCIAWDMPFVSAALVRRLAAGLAEYDAVLPESGGRRGVEPLCAAYGPACGPAIGASLDAGDLRAIGFHARVRVGTVSVAEIEAIADPALVFFNVNTADDLVRAGELWRARASSP